MSPDESYVIWWVNVLAFICIMISLFCKVSITAFYFSLGRYVSSAGEESVSLSIQDTNHFVKDWYPFNGFRYECVCESETYKIRWKVLGKLCWDVYITCCYLSLLNHTHSHTYTHKPSHTCYWTIPFISSYSQYTVLVRCFAGPGMF